MRVLQVYPFGRSYLQYFNNRFPQLAETSSQARVNAIVNHRHCGVHLLRPVVAGDCAASIVIPDDAIGQTRWANERGLLAKSEMTILMAQIEDHRTEVVYCLNPARYDSGFVRKLPGCVKKTVCWQASAASIGDLAAYDLRLCNFPPILEAWESRGMRAAYFSPAYDEAMGRYVSQTRSVDVVFVGGFTRHHKKRNQLLAEVAKLSARYDVRFHLDIKAWLRVWNRMPGVRHLFPSLSIAADMKQTIRPPLFGLELYELLGKAKIVFNAAIDMAGNHRGNMRCYEAMGCGAVMLSDEGIYPIDFVRDRHFLTYRENENLTLRVADLLERFEQYRLVGASAHANIKEKCNKDQQWRNFSSLVSGL